MKLYITPPRMSREKFLETYGQPTRPSAIRSWDFHSRMKALPVVLVIGDNFSYARVFTSTREAVEFFHGLPQGSDIECYGVLLADMERHRVMPPECFERARSAVR